MIGSDRLPGLGAWVRIESGKSLVDYVMGGGILLAGHDHPDVVAEVRATRAGLQPPDPFDGPHVLTGSVDDAFALVREIQRTHDDLVVSDESVHYGRIAPVAGWDIRVIGPAGAAGMAFAAVLVRDGALLAGVEPPMGPAADAVAAAAALGRVMGPLVVAQLSGRSERLAFGIAEVGGAVGLDVGAEQPGGWFELSFGEHERRSGVPERFSAAMWDRGFLVPDIGPWWPSLAHDYYTIEHTIDAAAAAMAVAADVQ